MPCPAQSTLERWTTCNSATCNSATTSCNLIFSYVWIRGWHSCRDSERFFSLFIRCLWPVNSANLRAVFRAGSQSEPSPRGHGVLTSTFQFFSKHRAYICRLSAILTAYIMLPELSLSLFILAQFLSPSLVDRLRKVETDSSLTTRCHWLDIAGSSVDGTRPRWPFGRGARQRTEHYSTTGAR